VRSYTPAAWCRCITCAFEDKVFSAAMFSHFPLLCYYAIAPMLFSYLRYIERFFVARKLRYLHFLRLMSACAHR